jgi:hypothetical protein
MGRHDPSILYHQGVIALEDKEFDFAKQYFMEANRIDPHFSIKYSTALQQHLAELKKTLVTASII